MTNAHHALLAAQNATQPLTEVEKLRAALAECKLHATNYAVVRIVDAALGEE